MLASPAIPPGGEIPTQYTCDRSDISPPLSWPGVPQGTQSLVLVAEDPDAPSGVFRHWAAFDIPPASHGLDGGYSANRPATGIREARNDFGKTGYGGLARPEATAPINIISAYWRSAGQRSNSAGHRRPQPMAEGGAALRVQQTELVGTYHR